MDMDSGFDPCFFLIAIRPVGGDVSGFFVVTIPWYLFFSAECNAELKTRSCVLFSWPPFHSFTQRRTIPILFFKHLSIPGLENASSPDRVRGLEEPSPGHNEFYIDR